MSCRPCLRARAPAALLALAFATDRAEAHALAGDRQFPVTLTLDDPGVADEASIPTFTYNRSGADGGPGPTHEYDFNFEYDKRITTNLGIAINYGYDVLQTNHDKTRTGFENLFVTLKDTVYVNAEHEFIVSIGLQREIGGTATEHTGGDRFGATTPLIYAGKGLGDLPVDLLRPFAVTGELGYTFADKALKVTTAPDGSTSTNGGNNNAWFGGVSLQYSLPYLHEQVHDYGLPDFANRITPLVEVTWTSPATAPSNNGTAWTVAPGLIYSGDWFQVGIEALIPATRAAGTNVGAIAQFHLFLDDIFPNSIGRPIFQ